MLAGGQIAGVSGLLPHCFDFKHGHESGVTPTWSAPAERLGDETVAWPYSVAKTGFSSPCLPVCPSGSAMSKLFHGRMCLDIVLMCSILVVRTWHISYPFTASQRSYCSWEERTGWVQLLLCYAGVNVHRACGFEFEHGINIPGFTCAWLHEPSLNLLRLGSY